MPPSTLPANRQGPVRAIFDMADQLGVLYEILTNE